MEYQEDDYLMISGIQHFQFCRRQWALIHIEQQWEENVHTAIGDLMHKKVHDPYLTEKRKGVLVVRALPVSSKSLGFSGECDVVEFHQADDGVKLHGHRGFTRFTLLNIKKGSPKARRKIFSRSQHRPCVWKKCFLQKLRKQLFFMVKQGEGKMLLLQGNFVSR